MRKYLYHATHRENLEFILREGLVRDSREGIPGGIDIPGVVWLDSGCRGLRKWLRKNHPDDWVILSIRRSFLNPKKLVRSKFYITYGGGRKEKSTWYTYKGDIPKEAIHVVG